MIRIGISLQMIAVLATASAALGDIAPREGTFTSYFFIDRWGQPVFDRFYVDPGLVKELSAKGWYPVTIVAKDIDQPYNPGGAMIRRIERAELAREAPLQLELNLATNRVRYGEATKLTVTLRNVSSEPVKLYRRDFLLSITAHKRGRHPLGDPVRDHMYDSQKNPYVDRARKLRFLRSTRYLHLFTETGDIRRDIGGLRLFAEKEGERKGAAPHDQIFTVIPPGEVSRCDYSIGSGWHINEYELQLKYRPRPPTAVEYILSKPIPFDVGETERYEWIMEQYGSANVRPADRQLQKEWEGTVNALATVVSTTDSELARQCAIERLTDMRAEAAVWALIQHVTLRGPGVLSLQEPLRRYPAALGLAEIGQPALRKILGGRLKLPATERELGLFAAVVHRHYALETAVGRFHVQHVLEEAQRQLEAEKQPPGVLVTWEKNLKRLLELYDALDRGELVPGAPEP